MGKELAVYDKNTDRLKYFNLFGNGLLGRVEANWDSVWVEDPNHRAAATGDIQGMITGITILRIILEASE